MLKLYIKKIILIIMFLGLVLQSAQPVYAKAYSEKELTKATKTFMDKIKVEYKFLSAQELTKIEEDFRKTYILHKEMQETDPTSLFSITVVEASVRKKNEQILTASNLKAEASTPQKPNNTAEITTKPQGGQLTSEQTAIVNEKLVVVNKVRDFVLNFLIGIGVLTTVLALIVQAARLASVGNQPMLRAVILHNILMTCITAFVLGSLALVVKFVFYIAH